MKHPPRPHRAALALASSLLTALSALTVQPAQAAAVQWSSAAGGNDHWYEYVQAGSIFAPLTFDQARNGALSRQHGGQAGYLATITSAAEQAFVESAGFAWLYGFGASSNAYLGGSDAAVEGDWRWLDGPEAGQPLGYADWLPGHPVSAPGFEDRDLLALSINAVVAGSPPAFGWASMALSSRALGYLVEYGTADGGGGSTDPNPVPEPPAPLLVAAALGLAAWRRRRA